MLTFIVNIKKYVDWIKNWFGLHKKKSIIGMIALVLFLFISLGVIKVNYLLGDDLIMSISPEQKQIDIIYDETANAEFVISTNNDVLCETYCKYNFYDLSTGSLIDTGNITLKPKENSTFNYDLNVKKSKEGQNLYSFKTECSNVNKGLCFSDQIIRQDSSFLILNYRLSDLELEVKPIIQSKLQEQLKFIQNVEIDLWNINQIVEDEMFNTINVSFLNDLFEVVFLTTSDLINQWSQEDYLYLNGFFENDILNDQNKQLVDLISTIKIEMNNTVTKGNLMYDDLILIKDLFINIDDISSDFYFNKSQLLSKMVQLYDDYNRSVISYKNNKFSSVDFLKSEIEYVLININESKVELFDSTNRLNNKQSDLLCAQFNVTCNDILIRGCEDVNYISNTSTGFNLSYTVDECSNNESFEFDEIEFEKIEFEKILAVNQSLFESLINISLNENVEQCCVFGQCSSCCTNCVDDNYPVLFIHGHSSNKDTAPEYALYGFDKLQHALEIDGYINVGNVKPGQEIQLIEKGQWGKSGHPVSVKGTYYYNYYPDNGIVTLIPQKSENIETYALRLNEVIKDVKYLTGKNKVIIIAHSMGGLVARSYIDIFGQNSIDKLIMIATPNHGVGGKVNTFCSIIGGNKECDDLELESTFLKKLNDDRNPITFKDTYVIYGSGCETDKVDGDGIVTVESAKLDSATNYNINGSCDSVLNPLHTDLLDTDKYPQVYDIIKNILSEKN